ncbi:hypothetical protein [Facilibium subflavum]|uniref:hypothetical protein n=1 Tax=Facilibium subflavum TaxID=2219058 RepID=UPI000E64EE84|nr:hypothetical protein [Facilibium subflavum]
MPYQNEPVKLDKNSNPFQKLGETLFPEKQSGEKVQAIVDTMHAKVDKMNDGEVKDLATNFVNSYSASMTHKERKTAYNTLKEANEANKEPSEVKEKLKDFIAAISKMDNGHNIPVLLQCLDKQLIEVDQAKLQRPEDRKAFFKQFDSWIEENKENEENKALPAVALKGSDKTYQLFAIEKDSQVPVTVKDKLAALESLFFEGDGIKEALQSQNKDEPEFTKDQLKKEYYAYHNYIDLTKIQINKKIKGWVGTSYNQENMDQFQLTEVLKSVLGDEYQDNIDKLIQDYQTHINNVSKNNKFAQNERNLLEGKDTQDKQKLGGLCKRILYWKKDLQLSDERKGLVNHNSLMADDLNQRAKIRFKSTQNNDEQKFTFKENEGGGYILQSYTRKKDENGNKIEGYAENQKVEFSYQDNGTLVLNKVTDVCAKDLARLIIASPDFCKEGRLDCQIYGDQFKKVDGEFNKEKFEQFLEILDKKAIDISGLSVASSVDEKLKKEMDGELKKAKDSQTGLGQHSVLAQINGDNSLNL